MDKNIAQKNNKLVHKGEFLKRVAQESGCPMKTVTRVYTAMINQVEDAVCNDEKVVLSGFGKFYLQLRKGHPIQFSGPSVQMNDYFVFKFKPSVEVSKRLRLVWAERHPK